MALRELRRLDGSDLPSIGSGTDRSTTWLLAIDAVAVGTVCGLTRGGSSAVRIRAAVVLAGAPPVAGRSRRDRGALALGPLRFQPKPWNPAKFQDALSGKILSNMGVTRGIVSMAGTGDGAQQVLVRADLWSPPPSWHRRRSRWNTCRAARCARAPSRTCTRHRSKRAARCPIGRNDSCLRHGPSPTRKARSRTGPSLPTAERRGRHKSTWNDRSCGIERLPWNRADCDRRRRGGVSSVGEADSRVGDACDDPLDRRVARLRPHFRLRSLLLLPR